MSDEQRDEGLLRRLGHLAGSVGNAAVGQVDADLIVRQIDVNDVVARIDINDVLDRVEVNELLDRVDVDRLLDTVDVDRLLERVDVDRLLDRVDIDRLLERADIEGLIRRAGIPEIIAESTGMLAGSTLDLVRRQVVGVDVVVTRLLRRLLGQGTGESDRPDRDAADVGELSGEPAGILTRGLALIADVSSSITSLTLTLAGVSYLLTAVLGRDETIGPPQGPWFVALTVAWMTTWWVLSLGIAGRTPGMWLVGLRVTAPRTSHLTFRRAVVRTIVQGVGTIGFGVGYIPVLFDGRRRAVHDRIAGTEVVYDWGGRETRVASPLANFLSNHTE